MFNQKQAQGLAGNTQNTMPGSMPHQGVGGYQLAPDNSTQEGTNNQNDQDALDIVQKVAVTQDPNELQELKERAQAYIDSGYNFNTPGANNQWTILVNTLTLNSQQSHPTSGMKTPQEVAKHLMQMFGAQKQRTEQQNNGVTQGATTMTQQSKIELYNLHVAQSQDDEENKKKKKRGNPFRVLMGQVGKLLDHGMGKSDIVRYLHRKMKYFDEETVRKAVDIVKDYNRKKHQKTSSNQTLVKTAYNNYDGKTIYSIEPEWEKRSSGELMARAAWLGWLLKYNPSLKMADGKKAADVKGASEELRKVRNALRIRGWADNEIP